MVTGTFYKHKRLMSDENDWRPVYCADETA